MTNKPQSTAKPRSSERFEREAKALQKNIAKRKRQQQEIEKLKQEKHNGQD